MTQEPDRIRRLVYFCRTGQGDLIGWDPQDITVKGDHEYSIYEVGRKGVARRLASTFTEFIEQVCLGEENLHPAKWDYEGYGSRRTFDPA